MYPVRFCPYPARKASALAPIDRQESSLSWHTQFKGRSQQRWGGSRAWRRPWPPSWPQLCWFQWLCKPTSSTWCVCQHVSLAGAQRSSCRPRHPPPPVSAAQTDVAARARSAFLLQIFQTKCIMEDLTRNEEVHGQFWAFNKDHPDQPVHIDTRVSQQAAGRRCGTPVGAVACGVQRLRLSRQHGHDLDVNPGDVYLI